MKRVDEYGPTSMEKAEYQLMAVESLLDSQCLTVRHTAQFTIKICRAMLAAMREHSEMMKKSIDTPVDIGHGGEKGGGR